MIIRSGVIQACGGHAAQVLLLLKQKWDIPNTDILKFDVNISAKFLSSKMFYIIIEEKRPHCKGPMLFKTIFKVSSL